MEDINHVWNAIGPQIFIHFCIVPNFRWGVINFTNLRSSCNDKNRYMNCGSSIKINLKLINYVWNAVVVIFFCNAYFEILWIFFCVEYVQIVCGLECSGMWLYAAINF